MTTVIPYRPDGDDPRSIALLLSNFDAVTAALDAHLAVPGAGFAAAGSSVHGSEVSMTNQGTYAFLSPEDRVSAISMPTDGLLAVWYKAVFNMDHVNGQGNAAIFLNGSQVEIAHEFTTTPKTQAADLICGQVDADGAVSSFGAGLAATTPRGDVSVGDVTTGQIVGAVSDAAGDIRTQIAGANIGAGGDNASFAQWGGPVWIYAAAGTYDVGIKWKMPAHVLKVKNRKLWVAALAF
jgi:hypothetical protein